ncbi:MAG: hypothetical protein MUE40_13845 [Anaerolineae bacterium]|nr:hypothetical protein [Anaerolineae bacterium]
MELHHYERRTGLLLLLALLLAGCLGLPPATPVNVRLPLLPTAAVTVTPAPATPFTVTLAGSLPPDVRDELALMQGICFEAAHDAAGRVFVLRGALEHIRFYDAADHARLCRQPVTRYPFDFEDGRVLAGLWSRGAGCTARHDVLSYTRDAAAQSITVRLRFVTEGDCPYELVRPFWISLPDAGAYAIDIVVES